AMNTVESEARTRFDLSRTGPGTPMGRFMRRFWIPVHRAEDLLQGHAKPIRIMSEDFALYRGETGHAQVIDYRCPHRGAQMHLGWVEGDAIRCVYHGWKFDRSGQCIEQPAEEAGFARKVRIGSYPTREYLGLIYAYFGAGEPPPFPPYPAPIAEGLIENQTQLVPCNWLQCFENSMDEVHVAFVHPHRRLAFRHLRSAGDRRGRDRLGHAAHRHAPGKDRAKRRADQPALHAELHPGHLAADGRARRRRRLARALSRLHADR